MLGFLRKRNKVSIPAQAGAGPTPVTGTGLVHNGDRAGEVSYSFSFDPHDPQAVVFTVDSMPWVFGRDLLTDGLGLARLNAAVAEPLGMGQVKVLPVRGNTEQFLVVLCTGSEEAVVSVSSALVEEFLTGSAEAHAAALDAQQDQLEHGLSRLLSS